MAIYDYREAMKNDILEYIHNNIDLTEYDRLEELEEKLNDELWMADEVTGNASGSYTFSTYQAEEYIAHNLDLLAEAASEFGGGCDVLKDGAEACDVTIRCYLLGECIAAALEELEEEFEEAHREEEINFSDYKDFNDFCAGRDCNKCPLFNQTMIDKNFDCEEYFKEVTKK